MINPLSDSTPWNRVAKDYATDVVPAFEYYAREALSMVPLSKRAHVLDVAAGPGTLSLLAAQLVEDVVAVDFSEAMVDALRQRLTQGNVSNVRPLMADGQALPFEDASFDAAFSMFGLMFFPDRAAGFREMLRVLRPGGRGLVSSWATREETSVRTFLFEVLKSKYPSAPALNYSFPLAGSDEAWKEMQEVGFSDITARTVDHTMVVPSVSMFWTTSVRTSALIVQLREGMDAADWNALSKEVATALKAEFGSEPQQITMSAHLTMGKKPA